MNCLMVKMTREKLLNKQDEVYYNAGFLELDEYLGKRNYNKGYYVIFDYNQSNNAVVKKHGEIYNLQYNKKDICVIFIKMNAVRPSKKYKNRI